MKCKNNYFFYTSILFLYCFLWYVLDGGIVETGGDAVSKWKDIKDYFDFSLVPGLDHHSLRWSVNLPMLFGMYLFNTDNPLIYHFVMAFYGAGVSVLIFRILIYENIQKYSSIVAALLVLGFTVMNLNERAYTQFLPSGFLVFYMLMALFLIRKAYGKNSSSGKYFFMSSMFCFFAYGAKLTSIWFIIPFFLYVGWDLIKDNRKNDLLFLIIPFIIGLILETLVVYLLTDYSYGRAFYVLSDNDAHGRSISGLSNIPPQSGFLNFSDYLLSPLKYYFAYGKYSIIIYSAVALSVFRLIFLKNVKFDNILMFVIVIFFILQSYVITRANPYVYPEYYTIDRYQYPLLVLSFLVFFISFSELFNSIKMKYMSVITALLFFLFSLMFLAKNDKNNYGFLSSYSHNVLLNNWVKSDGNVGYKVKKVILEDKLDIGLSVNNLRFHGITSFYVDSLYGVEYCNYTDTYIYEGDSYLYASCSKKKDKDNTMLLLYTPSGYEFYNIKSTAYLGKYSDFLDN